MQTLDNLKEQASSAALRPLYKQAYSGRGSSIWTPELNRLAAAPAISDAIRSPPSRPGECDDGWFPGL